MRNKNKDMKSHMCVYMVLHNVKIVISIGNTIEMKNDRFEKFHKALSNHGIYSVQIKKM